MLTRQRVRAHHENDVVVLEVGRATARFGYSTARVIAKALRIAGVHCCALEGITASVRRQLKSEIPAEALEAIDRAARIHPAERGTAPVAGLPWAVKVDGKLALLEIGNVEFAFDGPGALDLSTRIRVAAKLAKRWAGDTGKTLSVGGMLTNAEDNYRRGIA